VFDFFNLSDEDYNIDVFEFEPESDIEAHGIDVDILITDDHLIISCISDTILDKTIMMLKMDGMVLIPQEDRDTSRVYKFLGTSTPISLN
jgi:hypothetical protein